MIKLLQKLGQAVVLPDKEGKIPAQVARRPRGPRRRLRCSACRIAMWSAHTCAVRCGSWRERRCMLELTL